MTRARQLGWAMLPLLLLLVDTPHVAANPAQLTLTWIIDYSTYADGFSLERATGTGGAFAEIARVGAGVSSYVDSNLTAGTIYCYQVRAFNSIGYSAYSNQACGTAYQTFALVVVRAGTGSGTVTSQPTGTGTAVNPNPNVSTRNAKTSVVVANGESIVLGGLIRENSIMSSSGLPLLSKIPVLGALFGSQHLTKDRTELVLLITPKIIIDPLQARDATNELRSKLPALEKMLPAPKSGPPEGMPPPSELQK